MSEVDNQTISYYDNNANAFLESSISADMSATCDIFLSYLPMPPAKIMDLGCGTGRDSAYFKAHGYDVLPVDASAEMCKIATTISGINALQISFEALEFEDEFDGVWACASLLHVRRNALQYVLNKVSKALNANGIAYLSFKYGSFEGERNGRFFTDMNETDIPFLCNTETGFKLITCFITKDVRIGHEKEQWLNLIVNKVQK